MRQQRAQCRLTQLVRKLRRDGVLDDRVAILFHLADVPVEALRGSTVFTVGVLNGTPTHVVMQMQQQVGHAWVV